MYASNRGHDSIVLFEVDREDGTLRHVEDQNTMGRTPRHFELDREGDHLVIANQDTDTLLVCRIDGSSGRMKPSGVTTAAPSPVCVKFLPPSGRP